jgi:hypothetical protein
MRAKQRSRSIGRSDAKLVLIPRPDGARPGERMIRRVFGSVSQRFENIRVTILSL